ncbi:hypothetical protein [Mucilaginibacter antarcticus]|uniref:hypothetical protein n=1 Tax=Mucilaginibacter antarcticus TaxID=1855725 RepID=UPI0036425EC0
MEQNIIDQYTQNTQQATAQAQKFKQQANEYSLMRLAIFVGLFISVWIGATNDNFTFIAISVVVLVFAFAWLVSRQSKYERQMRYFNDLALVNQNEINSIQTRGNIYDNGSAFGNDKHFYTSDLDIFGHASLFQLINRAATSLGSNRLATWLSAPAKKDIIVERQEAAAEIVDKNQWKLEFQTLLLFANKTDTNQLKGLFAYLKAPLNIPGEQAILKYIKVAPYLLSASIVASLFWPIAQLAVLLLGAANLVIVVTKGSYIAKSSAIADKISKTLASYSVVFDKIENQSWQAKHNIALAKTIKDNHTSKNIAQLAKLIDKLSYNLIMVVGFVLNVFLLWALKQTIAIEQWKRNNHESLEDAFEVIAGFEALASIAGIQHNYPDWATLKLRMAQLIPWWLTISLIRSLARKIG